jgi:hypothetical protein
MTYGLDECRRCGAKMRPRKDGEAVDDQRPSRMPEAQWRAAGFKIRPTVAQAQHPGLGCCTDCKAFFLRKRWKPGVRIGSTLAGTALLLGLIYWLATVHMP